MGSNEVPPKDLREFILNSEKIEWNTPLDLGRMSIAASIGPSNYRTLRSKGTLRLFGAAVPDHDARMDAAGQTLINFQKLVSTAGAVRNGIKTLRGKIRDDIVALTQLRVLVPLRGGSVVFDFTPETLPSDELTPGGAVAIFDQNKTQFVDECVRDAIKLLSTACQVGPNADESEFIRLVEEGGPRLAKAVRDFASSIEQAEFNVDLTWTEPDVPTTEVTLTQSDAARIRKLVQARELDTEQVKLTGHLVTISTLKSWQLQIDVDQVVTVDASAVVGPLSHRFTLMDFVTITAIPRIREFPGGVMSTSYRAVSVDIAAPEEYIERTLDGEQQ